MAATSNDASKPSKLSSPHDTLHRAYPPLPYHHHALPPLQANTPRVTVLENGEAAPNANGNVAQANKPEDEEANGQPVDSMSSRHHPIEN